MIQDFIGDILDNTDNKINDFYIKNISEVLNEKVNSDIQMNFSTKEIIIMFELFASLNKIKKSNYSKKIVKIFERIKNEFRRKEVYLLVIKVFIKLLLNFQIIKI